MNNTRGKNYILNRWLLGDTQKEPFRCCQDHSKAWSLDTLVAFRAM